MQLRNCNTEARTTRCGARKDLEAVFIARRNRLVLGFLQSALDAAAQSVIQLLHMACTFRDSTGKARQKLEGTHDDHYPVSRTD